MRTFPLAFATGWQSGLGRPPNERGVIRWSVAYKGWPTIRMHLLLQEGGLPLFRVELHCLLDRRTEYLVNGFTFSRPVDASNHGLEMQVLFRVTLFDCFGHCIGGALLKILNGKSILVVKLRASPDLSPVPSYLRGWVSRLCVGLCSSLCCSCGRCGRLGCIVVLNVVCVGLLANMLFGVIWVDALLMSDEQVASGKGFGTDVANVRLLFSMRTNMALQMFLA
jgi:hypothetical protein